MNTNTTARQPKKLGGFTLIELLVVISIIGLLSSVVLASLSSARAKAKDAAIKTEAAEMRKIMELVYDETGSYASMQRGWFTADGFATCEDFYANVVNAQYRSSAIAICKSILQNAPDGFNPPSSAYQFYSSNSRSIDTHYSLMIPLNIVTGKWHCVGSSGSGDYDSYGGPFDPLNPNAQPVGCWGNP